MKWTDTVALSVAGYSAQDIRDIKALEKEKPEVIQMAKAGAKLKDIKDLIEMSDPDDTTAGNSDGQEPTESESTPDYKKLYEDQKKEIDELKATVSNIQKQNASKDVSGNVKDADDLDIFADLLTN